MMNPILRESSQTIMSGLEKRNQALFTHFGEVDTSENSPIRKEDGRLFPEMSLYCENQHRPYLRGVLHLLTAIVLLTVGIRHLIEEARGDEEMMSSFTYINYIGFGAASFYVISNIFCYGVSGIYHVGRWSINTEILLQKLDHCGIGLLSCGTSLPSALLVVYPHFPIVGICFATSNALLTAWLCLRIFDRQPSVLRQVIVAGNFIPYLPWLLSTYGLNRLETCMMLSCAANQFIGVLIFTNQKPRLCPKWFGYHGKYINHLRCIKVYRSL
jgi:predicted membrane channel-forming protein YqfA (hemolysin III family)